MKNSKRANSPNYFPAKLSCYTVQDVFNFLCQFPVDYNDVNTAEFDDAGRSQISICTLQSPNGL